MLFNICQYFCSLRSSSTRTLTNRPPSDKTNHTRQTTDNLDAMVHRPARTGDLASVPNIHDMTPESIDTMPQANLAKLKQDARLVSVQHRDSASQQFRMVKEKVPVAMIKAVSGYCSTVLEDAQKSMVSITGGVFGAVKEAVDWIPQFCDNKNFIPQPKGVALRYWMRLHEAAELMQVPVLAGTARIEYLILLERPISEADVTLIAQNFSPDSPYIGPVLDNMYDSMIHGMIDCYGPWNSWDTDLAKPVTDSTNMDELAFFSTLKTRVDEYTANPQTGDDRVEQEQQSKAAISHAGGAARSSPSSDMSPLPAPKRR